MDDREARRARRREIDEMVRDALRAETTGARPTTVVVPAIAGDEPGDETPGPPPRRVRRGLLVVAGLLVLAALTTAVLRLEQVPLGVQVLLGRETREPAVPTVYDDGTHAFRHTQPQAPDEPVGYDPCDVVPVSMNFADAPPDALAMLTTSIKRINRLSGLRLRYVGASDEEVTDRHGGPVLVRWFRTPGGHRPTGRAWSDDTPNALGRMSYYSGSAMLATGDFPGSRPLRQAVMDRSLAQLVGLAEVDAPGELMSVDHEGRTTFGHGDLTGLALLGRVPCA